MPDTEQNQKEYPQPGTQKKGTDFPVLRILVLICPGSGALPDVAVAPCKGKETGEQALPRTLLSRLRPGDFLLALLLSASADKVFEKKGARCIDCRQCDGKSGSKDGVFKRKRPRQRLDEPGAL